MKVSHEERATPHHAEQSRVDIPTSYPKPALLAGVLPHDSKPRLSDSLKLPKQPQPKDYWYLLATNTYFADTILLGPTSEQKESKGSSFAL